MRHTTVADVMSTSVISARPQQGVVCEADLMAAVARADGGDERITDARATPMY
jgi:hypothetical protein